MADAKTSCIKLQQYRGKGDFSGAASYYDSLPLPVRRCKSVALELAQLHLYQGDYKRAAAICANGAAAMFSNDSSSDPYPDEIADETSACLEMCRAYIDISHRCRLIDGLTIAERVSAVWLKPHDDNGAAFCTAHDYCKRLPEALSRAAAHRQSVDANVASEHSVLSEHRVLIEFYYHKIRIVAAEQGLIALPKVRTEALQSLNLLYQFLQRNNRIREARFILFFRISLLNDLKDPGVPRILNEFVASLQNTEYQLEEAMTLLDLVQYYYNIGDEESLTTGKACLDDASEKLAHAQHKFGNLLVKELECMRLAKTDDPQVFRAKKDLASRFLDVECHQIGMRLLLFAITPVISLPGIREEVLEAIDMLQARAQLVEANLVKQAIFIDVLTDAVLQAPEYGRVLSSLERYWADSHNEMGPKIRSAFAELLSQVYSKLGRLEKAVALGQEALDICKGADSYVDKSESAFYLALCHSDCLRECEPGSAEELFSLQKSVSLLEEWVETDREHGYAEGERAKCFRLAEIEDARHNGTGLVRASKWRDRAMEIAGSSANVPQLNYVVETEVRALLRQHEYGKALMAAQRALELCQTTKPSPVFQLARCWSRVATTRQFEFRHHLETITSDAEHDWSADVRSLFEALSAAFEALQLYRSTQGADVIVNCTNHLWSLIEDIALFSEEQAKQISPGLLAELADAESFCDKIRRGVNTSAGIDSLMQGRLLVSRKEHLKLYSAGVQTCLRLDDTASAWLWIQKGKARALSDAYGYRTLVPDSIMNAIKKDAAAHGLYIQEMEARANALYAAPEAYVGASREIDRIREEMMQLPLLKQVLALREGAFDVNIESAEIETSLHSCDISKASCKYVDWYIARNSQSIETGIFLFVRSLDGNCQVRQVSLTIANVKSWVQKTFYYPDGADPPLGKKNGNRHLAEMDKLVESLAELTQPNDLLILSPAELLNRIPLHGLKVDGKVLIERNLVVYSSSSAILRHVLIRANSQLRDPAEPKPRAFLGVYDETDPDGRAERDEIYKSLAELASASPGSTFTGSSATKHQFRAQCAMSKWIHYHGHAISDPDNVLQSALVLSSGQDQSSESSTEDNFTVAEIFELPFARGCSHANIIACDSSTQDIAAGNEPLGIVSAMLFAGATSVLGCLWPIESFAGRAFSAAFYAASKDAQITHDLGSSVLNLALAQRMAVCKLRNQKSTQQPYHWASFVLHGSWFWVS